MAALTLYVNTFRTILRIRPEDFTSWSHIYGSLSCLRESLLCCVCRKLMVVPTRSVTSHCQHNACKNCIDGEIQMMPQCIWCLDYKKFEDDVQLRIVLQCYKKMCKYIKSCGYFRHWNRSEMSSPMLNFLSMVNEGAILEDDYHYSSSHVSRSFDNRLTLLSNFELGVSNSLSGRRTIYSIKLSDNEPPKVMFKKTTYKGNMHINYDSEETSDSSGFDSSNFIEECLMSLKKRRSCRCGMATRNPGKLTCCGQRCPCYVAGRACFNCRCRGCRNPQKLHVTPPSTYNFHSLGTVDTGASYVGDITESSDEITASDSDQDPSI